MDMLLVTSEDVVDLRCAVLSMDRGLTRLSQRGHLAGIGQGTLDAVRDVQRDIRTWWMAQRERLVPWEDWSWLLEQP